MSVSAAAYTSALAIIALFSLSACQPTPKPTPSGAPALAAQPAPKRWLKGQTHLHSGSSGDSQTPPAEVVAWYADKGFDFIVFTDHNVVTDPPKHPSMLTIPGVELTQNLYDCTPSPPEGFGCLLHVNALFTQVPASPQIDLEPGEEVMSRLALFERALSINAELNGVAQLNHPNFHWAADAGLIVALSERGLRFVEIANESIGCQNEGDKDHPSTEALWDQVLSQGAKIYGVATDDAHHYNDASDLLAQGQPAYVGDLGYVMVRAEPDVASIREAMLSGDFYSTNGVSLKEVAVREGALFVEASLSQEGIEITFIGPQGATLSTVKASQASYPLPKSGQGQYLRAVVTDARGKKAWVQPIWP